MKRSRKMSLSFFVIVFAALTALFVNMAPTEAAPAHEGLYESSFGVSAEEGQVVGIPAMPSATTQFAAFLSGDDEVPPVVTDASGVGRFSLAEDGTLSWEIAVRNIADITAAHIHPGAPGVNGPPLFTLYDGTGTFDPDNPISGDVMLTPAQVNDLLAGNYYVNVHTTGNPSGEIRGQINPAQTWAFGAFLAGQSEVPLVNTTSAGRAFLTLSADMTQLHYLVILENVPGVTASHIHEAPAGTNGPVIFPLFTGGPPPFDEDNPVKGTLTPTITQVAALLGGDYYVNVHTMAYPSGEIRGQLAAVTPRLESHALLTGDREKPEEVDTDAAGLATFSLSADLSTLEYTVIVDEITDITAAHLHAGWPEGTGPVVHTLYDGTGSFDPDNPISGQLPFDAQNVLDYWAGYYYVNVHTTANPAGEIRGQLEGPTLFEAYLSGHNEVPPVTTAASAHTVMALSEDASTLYYRVLVANIEDVTAAHIHAGGEGENGPVVYTLFDGTGTFDPDNPISGSISVNEDDILALLADDYYVNVHTAANPGGEVRGQITGYEEFDFFEAFLDGDQEVPPVNTDATGFGFFNFDDGNAVVYYNVSVSDITDVTAAHIHTGPVGQNGPVAFPLYTGGGVFDPDHSISGGLILNAENLVDMFTGFYYVNVHTTAHPDGEIRGLLQVRPEIVFLPVTSP